jgi:hypothetical protein
VVPAFAEAFPQYLQNVFRAAGLINPAKPITLSHSQGPTQKLVQIVGSMGEEISSVDNERPVYIQKQFHMLSPTIMSRMESIVIVTSPTQKT